MENVHVAKTHTKTKNNDALELRARVHLQRIPCFKLKEYRVVVAFSFFLVKKCCS